MDWYYAFEGQQRGPVSETELTRLAGQGVIAPATLVWHAGLPDWQPWSSLCGMQAARGYPAPPLAAARFVYAGFWIRAVSYIIDGAMIGAIRTIVLMPLGMSLLDRPFASPWFFAHLGEAKLASLAVSLSYFVFFWTQYGATPGKMLFKLKVVTPVGTLITPGQAVIRYFGQILSGLILGIGFMMAGWDEQKRALHDRLANTRVIRENGTAPPC
ncbi:MAG: hypothetical protein QOJ99_4113 [Bryobacterales bacterium]|jgi:uncharacterized RDD family membrane protein YckC|nr:hypothetical protein [Bryobacterales bacterium]